MPTFSSARAAISHLHAALLVAALAAGPHAPSAAHAAGAAAPAERPPAGKATTPFRPAGGAARSAAAEEARRHFQQGVALHADGNFSGALAEFQAAQELWSNAGQALDALTALFNVGGLLRELQRHPEAIGALRRFVAESASLPNVTRSQRAELAQMRLDAQQLVTEMIALLAPVTLVVSPPEAAVLVDGRAAAPSADAPLELAAGSHVVEVSAEGHTPERREVTVVAGRPLQVEIALKAIPRTGRVRVTASRPDARIAIDGRALGVAPVEVELAAGGHRLEATAPGFLPHRSELALAAGQSREIQVVLEAPPPAAAAGSPIYERWWFWTALGVAAAGGVAAALLVRPGTEEPLDGGFGRVLVK